MNNKIKVRQRKFSEKCIRAWKEWFVKIYGTYPNCQICGRILNWNKEDGVCVCFDHRHRGEALIEGSPSNWIRSRLCSEKNQEIWLSCDFGILCYKCNIFLPTKQRKQRIIDAMKYVFGKGTTITV